MGLSVLGIPDWQGEKPAFMSGGTRPSPSGGNAAIRASISRRSRRADGRVTSVLHTYSYSAESPVLVFAQSSATSQVSSALRQLLAPAVRPENVDRVSTSVIGTHIAEVDSEAKIGTWSAPELVTAEFIWRGFMVAIAAWNFRMDDAFFRSLCVVREL